MTEKTIKAIEAPPSGSRVTYDRDEPGFGLRTTAAGVKAFVLNYYVAGRERRLTIGKWPSWSSTAARMRARELRQQIDRGLDPLGEREARRSAPTLADVVDQYISRHVSKIKSAADVARILRRDLLPELGSTKAVDIRKADLIKLVEARAIEAPIAANMLLTLTKGMFAWANRVDLLNVNPSANIAAPARKVARDRYLTEPEIRIFWRGLDGARIAPECRAALRLILTTGCRPGEAVSAEWADIQGDTWVLPATKTKAARRHVIPLSSLALEILAGCDHGGRWAFPSPVRPGRHITRDWVARAIAAEQWFGLPRFTSHDCRRTCATWLPCSRFIKARILGHADSSVSGVYDQFEYLPEKRAALQKWAEKIREITG